MRKFNVHLKATDERGVHKDIRYDEIKATDVTVALAAAITRSGIPLDEVYDLWVSERRD